MQRFIKGHDRTQASLLPACLEDYVNVDNPARVIEAFVEALDLRGLGFAIVPATTGRPAYHPATRLDLRTPARQARSAAGPGAKAQGNGGW